MKPSTCCRWPERRSPSRLRNSLTVSVKSVFSTFASQISSTWWYINFVMITSFCSVIEVCLLVHFILKNHWDFSLMPVICLEIGNSKIHDVLTNICLWWLLAISVFNKLSLQRKSTLAYCLTISFFFFFFIRWSPHWTNPIPAFSLQDLEDRKAAEVEDTTENEISDTEEDDLTDSQQTNKLSELYSTTIPSVDSAMESWDGSGMDAGYGSQGKLWINTCSWWKSSMATHCRTRLKELFWFLFQSAVHND